MRPVNRLKKTMLAMLNKSDVWTLAKGCLRGGLRAPTESLALACDLRLNAFHTLKIEIYFLL